MLLRSQSRCRCDPTATLRLQFYLVLVWGLICVSLAGVTWLPVLAGLWAPLSWTGAPPLAPPNPIHPERVVLAVPSSLQHAAMPVHLPQQHSVHGLPSSAGTLAATGHGPAVTSHVRHLSFLELVPAAARPLPHAPQHAASLPITVASVSPQRLRGTAHSVSPTLHGGGRGSHTASVAASVGTVGVSHGSTTVARAPQPHVVAVASTAVPAHESHATAHGKLPARFIAGRDVTRTVEHAPTSVPAGVRADHLAAHVVPVAVAAHLLQHGPSQHGPASVAAAAPAARQLPARMPSDQDVIVASDVVNYEFTFASLDVGVMVSAIMMVGRSSLIRPRFALSF